MKKNNFIQLSINHVDKIEKCDILQKDEWVFFDGHVVEAGLDYRVYTNISSSRAVKLSILDGAMELAAILEIELVNPPERIEGQSCNPEYGTSYQSIGIVTIPQEMAGGIYYIDGKYAFFVSRTFEPNNLTVVVPLTTMHFFNTMFGYNAYTQSYLSGERRHPFSARRPISTPIATKSMWMEGFTKWSVETFTEKNKISFVGDDCLREHHVLKLSKLVIIIGRSEYWTRRARIGLDNFIQAAGSAIFLSGETMYVEAESVNCGDQYRIKSPNKHWKGTGDAYPVLNSIGPNPFDGGFLNYKPHESDPGYGDFTILNNSKLFDGTGLKAGDKIRLPSTAFDGIPIEKYSDGIPVLDRTALRSFSEFYLIGYCCGENSPNGKIGAFAAFRKSSKSGLCIHFGSMSWTGALGLGGEGLDSEKVSQIVKNSVGLLSSSDKTWFDEECTSSLKAESSINSDESKCIICGAPVADFKLHKGKPRSCPSCGSSERVRTFAKAYNSGLLNVNLKHQKMLLISPSGSERRFLGAIEGLSIDTIDIRPQVKPDILADICAMPEINSDTYDAVYASCVLNCVYDLNAALSEIHRVLKPSGVFLNVEMLNLGLTTIERTDVEQITEYYGKDAFQEYRVGGYRSLGELDYHQILGKYFDVDMVNVFDAPYEKIQRWHLCTKGMKNLALQEQSTWVEIKINEHHESKANDLLAKEYFNIWETYPIQRMTNEIENSWLLELVKPNSKCLVLGSGGGRELKALLGLKCDLTAVDISPQMISVGQDRYGDSTIHWVLGNIHSLPNNLQDFDYVICLGATINYLKDINLALNRISSALCVGGTLIVSSINKEHPVEMNAVTQLPNQRVRNLYSTDEIQTLFNQCNLSIAEIRGYRFLVDLLPPEWNQNFPNASSEIQNSLTDCIKLEKSLINLLPSDRGKFFWTIAQRSK
ncbi:methyltransferase domain-containing protein [Lyngbya sp. CCY1209]|uniref:methyltransferase domain-containing protein n=1 Tax=Lyngbya sp. CCY1209 TaxID=2886103 RepID=UPI002D214234|nr:methyltransferase domain-containing protein [Lyngbya sp. CCY1209]MEB3884957.1 methyltransferase domain-containing protein [Lyngbya sp. CCY1209]